MHVFRLVENLKRLSKNTKVKYFGEHYYVGYIKRWIGYWIPILDRNGRIKISKNVTQ